jgi:hypothetical protein
VNKHPLHIILSSFLIVAYLVIFVTPVDKHDDVVLTSSGQESVTNHTCSSNEVHKNIDHEHDCLACQRQLTSVVVLSCDFVLPNLYPDDFHYQYFFLNRSFRVVAQPVLRGPPSFLTFA